MKKTPKSLRLQLGIFGRTNVGKSSFLNMVLGQDIAITSPVPGTTTDVVEKTMELLPLGPVVFLDTGGIDDTSVLSSERIKKTKKIFDRADIIILITEPDGWSVFEDNICTEAKKRNTPFIVNNMRIKRSETIIVGKNNAITVLEKIFSEYSEKIKITPFKERGFFTLRGNVKFKLVG